MTQPVRASDRQQYSRERDADRVVRGPSEKALAAHAGRIADALVAKATAREMHEPAPDEAVVQRRDAEEAPARDRP